MVLAIFLVGKNRKFKKKNVKKHSAKSVEVRTREVYDGIDQLLAFKRPRSAHARIRCAKYF